jgi:molybdopterin-containing oxidoreductase family iron-sulfur binding subunit
MNHAPISFFTRDDREVIARFPVAAELAHNPDRRQFLRVMAASLALAGLAGCDDDDPRDAEVPPVRQSQGADPAHRLTYPSAALLDGFANGVRVTTSNGRPIKIEGNPDHPWSRGGTDIFAQASVLALYDPFRSQTVLQYGHDNSWQAFAAALAGPMAQFRANGGAGLRVLTGPATSPTLAAQRAALQNSMPHLHWHTHAAIGHEALYESTQRVFGTKLETHLRVAGARVIVVLDGDCLDAGPHQVGNAKQWAQARRDAAQQNTVLPLHSAGSVPGLTAAKADFSVTASPAEIVGLAEAFLSMATGGAQSTVPGHLAEWFKRASTALIQARGAGILHCGVWAAPEVMDAVHRTNVALGNIGATVIHTAPVAPPGETLVSLAEAMAGGEVQALLMLDTNPIYDAPPELGFAAKLSNIPLKIHAGLYADETAFACDWHLPLAHTLESWGDARALDGTATIIQPCIEPLYQGRAAIEILSLVADPAPQTAFALVRAYWQNQVPAESFEVFWHQALLEGFVRDTHLPAISVQPVAAAAPASQKPEGGLTLAFRPDPTIWDGSPANNAWLQELPKPQTKLVWENAVFVSPALASREYIAQGDVLRVQIGQESVTGPAWIFAGQADDVVAMTLGYGRRVPNQLADGLGIDAYALRSAATPWHRSGVVLTRLGQTRALASTLGHTALDAGADGAAFIRVQQMGAPAVGGGPSIPPTLYPKQDNDGRAWGMVIDLDSCIGCNACITACQAENNIAVVGRNQVLAGREMHWLRIEAETQGGNAGSQAAAFMPVPCMQCEQAPCEIGCPVEATLHDHEGLNLMVYNRCIGTRACSGYCPYKVRRFNYFDYAAGAAPSLRQQRNPDVTVRAGGVMEKCTFCVQRIAQARITADMGNGVIPDGSVRTACQAACPTDAITFGDMADPASAVARQKTDARNYALLGELNTRPRTTYLARLAPAADAAG